MNPLPAHVVSPSQASLATPAPRAGFFRSAFLRILDGMRHGHLRLELPEGAALVFGDPAATEDQPLPLGISSRAVLRVRRPAFFRKSILSGDIGFADSYIDGDWETPNLTALVAWFIHNLDQTPTLSGSKTGSALGFNLLRVINRLSHLLRPNTLTTARRNISAHYDLSNDFFSLFLDPSMMYSSAKWAHPEQTLEEAQDEKNDALCRSLHLTSTDHVLEIGTGWGGWSVYAARHYGCRITTTTISREQLLWAQRRVVEEKLDHLIEVKFQDYRELTGQYDKLVSIEMLEAVGHAFHEDYFKLCARVLKPGGLLALQFINCADDRYDALRNGVDFIQKHIFPGSLLLSVNRVNELLARTGGFMLHKLDDLGHDYARTLRCWHQSFNEKLDEVKALGFDDRFIRKWNYYLCYCEAAFALRNISVVQTVHTRPNNFAL